MDFGNGHRWLKRTLISVVLSAVAVLCFAANYNERLAAFYELKIPAGAGPHPAVVAISGCSGFRGPMYAKTLRELRDAGFATIRVDYLAASGKSQCRTGNVTLVTKDEVAAYIGQTVAHLRNQTTIKKTAINLLGWSYGGGARCNTSQPSISQSLVRSRRWSPTIRTVEM